MEERVAIYIDGSNLYHKLRNVTSESLNLTSFDYGKFCEFLSPSNKKISFKGYYVGAIRAEVSDKKGQKLRSNQQRLFSNLLKQQFIIKKGFMLHSNGSFHEKGVDVQLAVDILAGAYEDLYDIALIISSDTDLIPAIKKAQKLGKHIEYVGFGYKPSYALINQCSDTRLLTNNDILKFIENEAEFKSKPKRKVKNHRTSNR